MKGIFKVYSPLIDPTNIGQQLIEQAQQILPCDNEEEAIMEGYGFTAQGRPQPDEQDYMKIQINTCSSIFEQIIQQPGFELLEIIED